MTKFEKKKAIDVIMWKIVACDNLDDLDKGIEKLLQEVYSSGFTKEMEPVVSNTLNNIVNNDLSKFSENIGKTPEEKRELLKSVGNIIFELIDSSTLPD